MHLVAGNLFVTGQVATQERIDAVSEIAARVLPECVRSVASDAEHIVGSSVQCRAMSEVFSIRLSDSTAQRLRSQAAETGEQLSRLAQRLIDEGLRMAAHPGIVFRPGPSGRRAALLRGPDVWQVVELLASLDERGDAAVEEAAEWLGSTVSAIRQALAYYGSFREEVDEEVAASLRAAAAAQVSWENQQALLR